jgi:DNA-binding NarL/FixJ family response regulator
MHESYQMVQRALDAGAQAYILKSDLTECLVKAVRVVSGGTRFLTPKVSEILLAGSLKATRERQQQQRSGARIPYGHTPDHVWAVRSALL